MTGDAPTTVRIAAGTHRIEVFAAPGAAFQVRGAADVSDVNGVVTISNVTSRLAVDVDVHTNLLIGATNGRVAVTGHAGHVAIVTETGRVEVESATSADIRSETSRVEVGAVTGPCRIRSGSGRVEVQTCGNADVACGTGRIELREVSGEVDAHSVSGRIDLSMASPGDIRAETVSGRIDVSLPSGTAPFQPIDATDRRLRPPGCDCTVDARSTTGKVVVKVR